MYYLIAIEFVILVICSISMQFDKDIDDLGNDGFWEKINYVVYSFNALDYNWNWIFISSSIYKLSFD